MEGDMMAQKVWFSSSKAKKENNNHHHQTPDFWNEQWMWDRT